MLADHSHWHESAQASCGRSLRPPTTYATRRWLISPEHVCAAPGNPACLCQSTVTRVLRILADEGLETGRWWPSSLPVRKEGWRCQPHWCAVAGHELAGDRTRCPVSASSAVPSSATP